MIFKHIYLTNRQDLKRYYNSGVGNNGNKRVLYTPQGSRTVSSTSNTVYHHHQDILWGGGS